LSLYDPQTCWADPTPANDFMAERMREFPWACRKVPVNDLGLCQQHHEEIVPPKQVEEAA